VPGGGYAYWQDGTLIFVMTNDVGLDIPLSDTDFSVFASEVLMQDLAQIAEVGFVGVRVAAIVDEILALEAAVQAAGDAGAMRDPSTNSLLRKLRRARDYAMDGLAKWEAGDEDTALFLWEKAAHQMDNFISELEQSSAKGKVREGLLEEWRPIAEAIAAALRALPAVNPLGVLPDAGAQDPHPTNQDGEPLDYYPWSSLQGTLMLPANGYTTFAVEGVPENAGFVCAGHIYDDQGNLVLTWVEQATAETVVPDTEPPVITTATSAPPNLWPPEHTMVAMTLDVTVTDNSGWALWYIQDVGSNQPEDGTGDGDYSPDWINPEDDLQSVWLRAERSGNHPTEVREYTVTLRAIDMAGNVSDPYELIVPVAHDQGGDIGPAQITSLAAVPTKGHTVQIVFTLAASSQVAAEVFNIAGRPIKTIVGDRQCPQGTNSLVWNCSSGRGLPVPSGTYLIRLTARTPDGQQGSRLCPVTVQR